MTSDSPSSLPIIDISALESSDPTDRSAVAAEIRAACLDKGFLYVVGHGIPDDLIADMWRVTRAFFALPLAEKQEVAISRSPCNRGYEPLAAQTLEAGTPPDQKEGYYIGNDLAADHPSVIARRFNHGPNQWPEAFPEFRAVCERYFSAMEAFGVTLMRGLALSLKLDETYFDDYNANSMSILRLLHYPPRRPDAAPDEKGAGAHTDWGGLTLLLQDDVGGLEVLDKDDRWIPAPPIPGAYVVNLGDMIQRWTNGRYRSTLHRVINSSGRERFSIPFFHEGNADYEMRCIDACLEPGEKPLSEPITVIQHLEEMYRKTYA